MTLTDDLHDTAAALRSGWPIQNLNRARRVRAEEQRNMGTRGTYSFISGGRHLTAIAYGRAFSRPLATIETWRETWVDEFDGAEVSK